MAFQLKVDISAIKDQIGQTIEVTRRINLPDYNGIRFEDDWQITVLINHTYHEYIVTGQAEGSYIANCDRCLESYSDHLTIDFNEVFLPHQETSSPDQQGMEYYLYGNEIDLTEIIWDSIKLSLPMKNLCSKGCKGLCAHCGTNLNTTKCSCESEAYDPRLAKLAELIKPQSNQGKGGGSDGQPKE